MTILKDISAIILFSIASSPFFSTTIFNTDTIESTIPVTYEACDADTYRPLMDEQLAYVDPDILTAFTDRGWELCITGYSIADTYYPDGNIGSIAGLTVADESIIYIEDRENAIVNATLHEIGHAIDWESQPGYTYASDNPDFTAIYCAEANLLQSDETTNARLTVRDYDISSPREYFAEYFMRWCWDSDIAQVCPQTNAFVQNCIETFINDQLLSL